MAHGRLLGWQYLEADVGVGGDLARQYPPGKELAIGGQSGGQPEQPGKEKASAGNSSLMHDYRDDRTK